MSKKKADFCDNCAGEIPASDRVRRFCSVKCRLEFRRAQSASIVEKPRLNPSPLREYT